MQFLFIDEYRVLLLEPAWNSQPKTTGINQSESSRNSQSQSNWNSHYFIVSCSIMVLANAPWKEKQVWNKEVADRV